jgi:hypothetical protein
MAVMILADQDEIRDFVEYPKKHNSWNIRDVYASILVKMWHDVKQQQKPETSTSGRLVSVKRNILQPNSRNLLLNIRFLPSYHKIWSINPRHASVWLAVPSVMENIQRVLHLYFDQSVEVNQC